MGQALSTNVRIQCPCPRDQNSHSKYRSRSLTFWQFTAPNASNIGCILSPVKCKSLDAWIRTIGQLIDVGTQIHQYCWYSWSAVWWSLKLKNWISVPRWTRLLLTNSRQQRRFAWARDDEYDKWHYILFIYDAIVKLQSIQHNVWSYLQVFHQGSIYCFQLRLPGAIAVCGSVVIWALEPEMALLNATCSVETYCATNSIATPSETTV